MRRLPQTPGRVLSGALALLLASAVALLASAQPASAHGTLAMSTPASGATVSEPLTAVQLFFTEKAAPNAFFTVTAPGGVRVDNGWSYGEPKPLDKPVREYFLVNGQFEPREYTTGFPATVAVTHLPAKGQYSVSYLSVASDGDTVRGTLTFRYNGRVTAAPKGWSPPTTQPDPALVAATEQHGSSGQASAVPTTSAQPVIPPSGAAAAPPTESADESGSGALAWAGWAAAIAAAVAAAGFVVWRRRTASTGRPTGRGRTAPGGSGRRGGGARTTKRPSTGRTGGAKAGGGKSGAAATGGGKSGAAATGARKTAAGKAGAVSGVGAQPTGGRRRPATVPAARTGDAVVTARTSVAVDPTPTDPEPKALATTEALATTDDEAAVDAGARSDSDLTAVAPGSRLSNGHLALLVGGLVVALLAGFGLARIGTGDQSPAGNARKPAGGPPASGQVMSATDGHQHPAGTGPHTHRGDGATGETLATGTTVSAGGYTLQPLERSQPAGVRADYRFRIVGTDRQPATRFAVVHDKPLHMIVVGRDLTGYQHVHPTMAADGTWSVPLTLARPGGYRVYADFSVTAPNGAQVPLVLGVDHTVAGAHTPAALPPAQAQATAGPYAVSMSGTPTVGVTAPMQFQVQRTDAAAPVQLERYLGAYGHLVVVREGDLGYVHVHPEQELVDGTVQFWLTAPSSGRYRAFFDFQVEGKVHTAEYTINVP
ncbi:copper resistance protein CopC [Micromonospora sp. WMMD964]|uniref:copper resistance CopC family protein n=1 Tax=Micromonospora sp. WMMD964 TaxID=3016091 RepID=UPI002499B631|nr:copper resistance protein CopC [Micromonospora sp. WMMD964]WFE99963.1 copper resistance protein CopC [Micromonospora sp. WMMD964]